MVSEADVRARLIETEARLLAMGGAIAPLQRQVAAGADDWHRALELLAEYYKRRRELEVYRDSLNWVLAQQQDVSLEWAS